MKIWSKDKKEHASHAFIEARGTIRVATASTGHLCLLLGTATSQHDEIEEIAEEANKILTRLIALEKKMSQVREL